MFQSLPTRMTRVLTRGPAAGKSGCLGLFAGWFWVVSSSSPVPPMLTAVQPGGRASFLGLSSGFSCLKATPSPSIVLLHPPPPSPTSFLSQSPSAVTPSDQASIPAFLSPADTYPLPVARRAPVCSSFLPSVAASVQHTPRLTFHQCPPELSLHIRLPTSPPLPLCIPSFLV